MKTRERIALAWTPLCLRLALAVTFVWAGAGKVMEFMEVQGEKAAVLANMGVALGAGTPSNTPTSTPGGTAPKTSPPGTPEETPKPAGPDKPLPPPAGPATEPGEKAPGENRAANGKGAKPNGSAAGAGKKKTDAPKGSGTGGSGSGTTIPVARPRTATASIEGLDDDEGPIAAVKTQAVPAPAATPPSSAGKVYEASDFPSPVRVRRVYGLALSMHAGAIAPAEKPGMTLWPARLSTGSIPVYLAWSVALTELVGGAAIFVGLLTRLAALGQAGVMLGAMWLTQIGPAIQGGNALLGFLPNKPIFDVPSWMPLLWQFALLLMAVGLFFAGPGVAAMDNLLFGGSGGGGKPKGGGGGGPSAPKAG